MKAIPFPPPKVMPSATTKPSPPLADPLCTGAGGGAKAAGCGGLRGGERLAGRGAYIIDFLLELRQQPSKNRVEDE
ncbi:unnamed protein product [Ilex paraguariensis]|uniref:Uncharacterized protein n=1 Tax=Ilex paraguariensis TaxID=185542 RepID=A0ABC8V202_9AQUA